MDEAYLPATFGPNISDFFDLCLYLASVVRGFNKNEEEMFSITKNELKLRPSLNTLSVFTYLCIENIKVKKI